MIFFIIIEYYCIYAFYKFCFQSVQLACCTDKTNYFFKANYLLLSFSQQNSISQTNKLQVPLSELTVGLKSLYRICTPSSRLAGRLHPWQRHLQLLLQQQLNIFKPNKNKISLSALAANPIKSSDFESPPGLRGSAQWSTFHTLGLPSYSYSIGNASAHK